MQVKLPSIVRLPLSLVIRSVGSPVFLAAAKLAVLTRVMVAMAEMSDEQRCRVPKCPGWNPGFTL